MKATYKVICIPYHITFSSTLSLYNYIKPVIQHIMKIDICQYWTGTISLWSSGFTVKILSILHDSCIQELPYYFYEFPVCNIMLQHLNQPTMVYRIKESSNICLHYIARFAILYLFDQISNCHVAAPFGTKSIAFIIELRFINLIQYLSYCLFYQFILIA